MTPCPYGPAKSPLLHHRLQRIGNARCRSSVPDDENAINKARRYGTLKYVGKNYPPVIFAHIACDGPEGVRDVGTWEYRIRNVKKAGFLWHAGPWAMRPMPDDKSSIRHWAESLSEVR